MSNREINAIADLLEALRARSPRRSPRTSLKDGGQEIPSIRVEIPSRSAPPLSTRPDPLLLPLQVGTRDLRTKLVSLLRLTRWERGCYLIAGYRGSGKTTLALSALDVYQFGRENFWEQLEDYLPDSDSASLGRNQLIRENLECVLKIGRLSLSANPQERSQAIQLVSELRGYLASRAFWNRLVRLYRQPVVRVHINLSYDTQLTPREVLFNTAMLLSDALQAQSKSLVARTHLLLRFALLAGLLWLLQSCGALEILEGWLRHYLVGPAEQILFSFVERRPAMPPTPGLAPSAIVVSTLLSLIAWWAWVAVLPTHASVFRRLRRLHIRLASTLETGASIGLKDFLGLSRNTKLIPLDERQIEAELLTILRSVRDLGRKNAIANGILGVLDGARNDVIFIVDEIDKIETARNTASSPGSSYESLEEAAQRRADKIDALLSALKGFITLAPARFIFIGGADLLDTYNADRVRSNSLYGSLFDDVVSVKSLLHIGVGARASKLSTNVERLLVRRILDPFAAVTVWATFRYFLNVRDTADAESGRASRHDQPQLTQDAIPFVARQVCADLRSGRKSILDRAFRIRTLHQYMLVVSKHDKANDPAGEGANTEQEVRFITVFLRQFVNYLTFYSAGNCKRLSNTIDYFACERNLAKNGRVYLGLWQTSALVGNALVLSFGVKDQQRILLGSTFYIALTQILGQQLVAGQDRLIVEAFGSLHHILRLKNVAFSRSHVDHTIETLNVSRHPELRSLVDSILSSVLAPYLRRIRNGVYRYRFTLAIEQEIAAVLRVSSFESSFYSFAQDSNRRLISHFQHQVDTARRYMDAAGQKDGASGYLALVRLYLKIGDLLTLQDSWDEAASYYRLGTGVPPCKSATIPSPLAPELYMARLASMLRLGETEERRKNYDRGAAIYVGAEALVKEILEKVPVAKNRFGDGDAKWDLLSQARLAGLYLSLKRSPGSISIANLLEEVEAGRMPFNTGPGKLRLARYFYFRGEYVHAVKLYLSFFLPRDGESRKVLENEKSGYLLGTALAGAGLAIIAWMGTCRDHGTPIRIAELGGEVSEAVKSLCKRRIQGRWNPDGELFTVVVAFALLQEAGAVFSRVGLSLHSALAFIGAISCYGLLQEYRAITSGSKWRWLGSDRGVTGILEKAEGENWVRVLGESCDRELERLHRRAFTESIRDCMAGDMKPYSWDPGLKKKHEEGLLEPSTLFRKDGKQYEKSDGEEWFYEGLFNQHSPLFQLYFATRLWAVRNLERAVYEPIYQVLPRRYSRPFGMRSSLMGHWLQGRVFLRWLLSAKPGFAPDASALGIRCADTDGDKRDLEELKRQRWFPGRDGTSDQDMVFRAEYMVEVLRATASGVWNFYQVLTMGPRLTGAEGWCGFPSNAIVLCDIWETLAACIAYVSRVSGKGCGDAVEIVRENLARFMPEEEVLWVVDFDDVCDRAADACVEVIRLSDPHSRARGALLQRKFYLSDDYEDGQFALEWALNLGSGRLLDIWTRKIRAMQEFRYSSGLQTGGVSGPAQDRGTGPVSPDDLKSAKHYWADLMAKVEEAAVSRLLSRQETDVLIEQVA